MIRPIIFILPILSIFCYSADKIFIRDYTYTAGETDSKLSCRQNAENEVKRLLLQELGTYILSVTVIENHKLTLDDIIAVSAGLTKSKILDERWNGYSYWIKMEIKADPEKIEKEIKRFVEKNVRIEINRSGGVTTTVLKQPKYYYGIPILIVGNSGKSYKGISLPGISGPGAFVNFHGVALGGLMGANANDDFSGFGAGFFNVAGNFKGIAVGCFNTGNEVTGVQIGAFNNIFPRARGDNLGQRVKGLQIGLINKAKILKGFQFGLFNTAENSFMPVMIGFNFAF